ncbi:MAG: two-component system sensor histidine kinase NtrB [Candidatus Kariarchaeaceae archaeon]|jgi:PAS domain S-box-containing protein
MFLLRHNSNPNNIRSDFPMYRPLLKYLEPPIHEDDLLTTKTILLNKISKIIIGFIFVWLIVREIVGIRTNTEILLWTLEMVVVFLFITVLYRNPKYVHLASMLQVYNLMILCFIAMYRVRGFAGGYFMAFALILLISAFLFNLRYSIINVIIIIIGGAIILSWENRGQLYETADEVDPNAVFIGQSIVLLMIIFIVWLYIQSQQEARVKSKELVEIIQNRYQILFEKSPLPISLTRGNEILIVNPAYSDIFGLDKKKSIQDHQVSDFQAPEVREIQKVRRAQRIHERKAHYQSLGLRQDGVKFPLDVHVAEIELEDGLATLTFLEDISDRKRAEEEIQRTRELLYQAQKMETLGRTVGGIAHDFKNLLMIIKNSGDLLNRMISPDGDIAELLSSIDNAADSGISVTNQLLSFSKKREMHMETVDLNKLLRKQSVMYSRMLTPTIELVLNLDNTNLYVDIDVVNFEQVILNLITNAKDAMPEGGRLIITTSLLENSLAEVSISDTGIGIDDELMIHLFEPFFTTKPEGTGLGLATSYGIIKQLGGEIIVKSEKMKGSTFTIQFPPR